MARTKISEFSATPANNTDIDGINIAEGCAPSGINDAIRELMAQLKDWQSGTSNDPYVIGSSGSLTLNQGTANGVPYLNGSKVITSGSALTFDGTNFATTGSVTSAGASNSGNLAFTGTGNRITGDFTNATVANRVMFQTSTANSSTVVQAIPNGTGNNGAFLGFNNSDPTNAAFVGIQIPGSEARFASGITGTGSYLPMTFYTGGSERMRLDTSGSVGIGTSSPAYNLDVNANTNSSLARVHVRNTNSGSAASTVFSLGNDGGNGQAGLLLSSSTNSTFGANNLVLINSVSTGTLQFWTNNTERARIDSSGNLLVGTTASGNAGYGGNSTIYQSKDYSGATAVNINSTSTTGTQYFAVFSRGGTACGTITSTATNSTTYGTSSDYRLKENVAPMIGALAKVTALKPCTYTWKSDGSNGQGFIAHELQEVIPEAVVGEKDAIGDDGEIRAQQIDTSFLVATLTAAIQEQQAIITALTARVTALETN